MKDYSISQLHLLANHKGFQPKDKFVSIKELVETLESWKPVDSEENLSDEDKMYIEITNKLQTELAKANLGDTKDE